VKKRLERANAQTKRWGRQRVKRLQQRESEFNPWDWNARRIYRTPKAKVVQFIPCNGLELFHQVCSSTLQDT
jgi:hypothetical protein